MVLLQIFQGGGGVQLFPGGQNANFYRNPYNYNLCFPGGLNPLSPSGSANVQ